MNPRCVAIVLGVFGWLVSAPASAQTDDERTLSPYFRIDKGATRSDAFVLEATDVTANITGVIADVRVRQVYHNQGADPIHATYVFPASTRAAVHGLEMEVGGARVVAKIKERNRAAEEFKQAQAEGKTATLLEQARPNVFTMALANVLPGDRVSVELRYSELLVPEAGTYSFVYPTVVGPRYGGEPSGAWPHDGRAADPAVSTRHLPADAGPVAAFRLSANLAAGMPFAGLHSNTHAVQVTHDNGLARVVLADESGGDRDFILQYRLSGESLQSGLLLYEGERENFFLMMVQPPARPTTAEIPPREYVFVLDISGSMHGFPLDTARVVMRNLLRQLRPQDSFNVLFFSGGSYLLSPRSLPATMQNVTHALHVVEQAEAEGGTELQAALEQAVRLPRSEHVSRSILLVTDGYIAQERGAFELIASRLHDTNFFAFGIGSSVNRYLIEGLARAGQGEPFVVTDPAEAPAVAQRFSRYVSAPLLTDVQVKFDGFDAYDVEPRGQPDLFAERPVVVFGKWRGARRGEIVVSGRGATERFTRTLKLENAASRAEHAALPQLWARTRIARLSDFNFDSEDTGATREVTQLGLSYSLLTRHTSFIAVLEQVRNPGGQGRDVEQMQPLPLGMSAPEAEVQYASGAEPELYLLLVLLLAGAAYRALRRRGAGALALRGQA